MAPPEGAERPIWGCPQARRPEAEHLRGDVRDERGASLSRLGDSSRFVPWRATEGRYEWRSFEDLGEFDRARTI